MNGWISDVFSTDRSESVFDISQLCGKEVFAKLALIQLILELIQYKSN